MEPAMSDQASPGAPTDHLRTGGQQPDDLAPTILRNIRALRTRRTAEQQAAGFDDRVAQLVSRFAGSMLFVYLHLTIVVGWILVNVRLIPRLPPFDPSFIILATVASVEAIFISTFVLISQNRAAVAADRRDELDLQINLLAEHEVTRLLNLVTLIAQHMGLHVEDEEELSLLAREVAPETILDTIAAAEKKEPGGG
jgi:uncharacterized membrane protein